MSEYLEALSRLNMPERTPGTTISRSLFYIPRKDTPYHQDRILRETLNTPLPKYTIPQRLIINHDEQETYVFPLDPQFTLSPGGRKSIAIRENSTALRYQNHNGIDAYTFNCDISYDDTNLGFPTHQLQFNRNMNALSRVLTPFTGYCDSISLELANEIDNQLNTALGLVANPVEFAFPIYGQNKIMIQLIPDNVNVISFRDVFGTDVASITYPFARNPHAKNSLIGIGYNEALNAKFEEDQNVLIISIECPNQIMDVGPICSSINPWGTKNIIGSIGRTFYPELNKLFPYDNSQQIKIWFINSLGNKVPNYIAHGYIDLELIIDNLNNFAMDD